MSPQWERLHAPSPLDGADLVLDVVLRPHRSLSLQAFKLMLIVVIAINVVIGGVFWLEGAFPVTGFLGLDVLALWIAFQINYRAARTQEHVRISNEHIEITRSEPNGRSRAWVTNLFWARAREDRAGVVIRAGGDGLRVAAFLSPQERTAFARQLDDALWRAKNRR